MQNFDTLRLDGRQLKLFLSVLDEGSVGRAADRFGLNQSTASHHLERLRQALGDPLFVKLGKGITPTDFAVSVAPRIRALVASLEGLSAEANHDPISDTRPITVATNTAECRPLLKKLSAAFATASPLAPQRFIELGSRARIESLLDTGNVDLVLTIRADRYPASVKTVAFSSDSYACFYDPEMRGPVKSVADFCTSDHAALDFGGSGKSTISAAIEQAGFSRNIRVSAPDISALSDLIRGTTMIATFQSNLADSALRHFASCEVPLALPNAYHDLVWHRRKDVSPRNAWLREMVLSCRDCE